MISGDLGFVYLLPYLKAIIYTALLLTYIRKKLGISSMNLSRLFQMKCEWWIAFHSKIRFKLSLCCTWPFGWDIIEFLGKKWVFSRRDEGNKIDWTTGWTGDKARQDYSHLNIHQYHKLMKGQYRFTSWIRSPLSCPQRCTDLNTNFKLYSSEHIN